MTEGGIFLVGKGHVSQVLQRELPVQATWTGEMDHMTVRDLRSSSAKTVVCCAGKTNLEWCEANPREAFRCNVEAPLRVLNKVLEAGKRMIHMSSGCVWDGPYKPGGGAFSPDDGPNPAAFYSWTKASCDGLMLARAEALGRLVMLRPRQVYSAVDSPRNTLVKLAKYESLVDTPNSMTSAYTIARTIRALCEIDWTDWFPPRIIAPYDRGVTSPLRFGRILAELGIRGEPKEIWKGTLDGWLRPRRVDVVMRDEKFEDLVNPPHVEDEIRRVASMLEIDIYG